MIWFDLIWYSVIYYVYTLKKSLDETVFGKMKLYETKFGEAWNVSKGIYSNGS